MEASLVPVPTSTFGALLVFWPKKNSKLREFHEANI